MKNLKKKFQIQILNWAKDNLIIYPWRENRTPYRTLISEILLIRTKAPQVVPIYIKFIETYPTLKNFLEMKLEIVENLIKSLGLLFRAEILRDLAEQIKLKFDSEIPNNFSDLKSLKGIGDYSANAVLCFGFGEKKPLLDTNFIRIYKRVFNINPKTKTPKTDKFLWNFSEELLPEKNYIQYNYGILDLGGTICLNRNPKCLICPIKEICHYFQLK